MTAVQFCIATPQLSDGEFATGEIGLDQGRLFVRVDNIVDALIQVIFGFNAGFHVDAHAGPFTRGFDKKWKFHLCAQAFFAIDEFLERGNG